MGLRLRLALFSVLLALTLLGPAAVMAATPVEVDNVAQELVCQCGCNQVLNQCNHANCSSRDQMMALIGKQLDGGRTKQQIIAGFVSQYGERVLSAPTKEGFNLTAWITPFAAILAGAVFVYFLVRSWVFRGQAPQPAPIQDRPAPTTDEDYGERLERELEDFSQRGGY